ncbi:hypothetical protein EGW08_015184 [Elysia chlorotica]|uniref:Helicase ATP-binding domain-containing protein n=1 Tax=Elysia chlorotica TaxID=188477 RepID=A0A433T682_ELYCH|nr:hypothetical protein EGW08_015184 [Elysia chlorotica]
MTTPLLNKSLALAQESNFNDLRTNMEVPTDKIYILQGGRGQCFVCQVGFTSDQNAKDHLSGQKHMKKVSALQFSLNRPQAVAVSPAVNPPTVMMSQHVQHISSPFVPGRMPSPVPGVAQENRTQSNWSAVSASSCQRFEENVSLHSATPTRGPNGEEYILNGSRGTCYVCNIELTSLEHAKSHLEGQKHRKKCASQGNLGKKTGNTGSPVGNLSQYPQAGAMPNTNSKGLYMCSVCDVPFSCLANAKEHFVSVKHKKKLAQKENTSYGLLETYARQGSSPSSFDQTDLKAPVPRHSLFVPLTNLSSESPVLETGLIRPFTVKPNPSTPSKTSLDDNTNIQYKPVPMKASLEIQPNSSTKPTFFSYSSQEFEIKEDNSPKNIGITGGNLVCDVAEIDKVKSKEVLGTHTPVGRQMAFAPKVSLDTCVIDNSKQGKVAPNQSLELDYFRRSHGQEFNGTGQNEGHPINNQRLYDSFFTTTPPVSSRASPKPVYTFDGQLERGFCYACNVDLTSKGLRDQHLEGQKHKKREALWELSPQTQVMHRPLATSTPAITHPGPQTPDIYPSQHSSPLNPHTVSGSPQENTTRTSPAQDPPDETLVFNGARGFCKACNIEISSPQHYNQHRFGKPHSRSRQRYFLSQKGIEYPLYCDVCKKPFTGQESAQQHFTSARHKTKMEILGKGGREVERLKDGRMIMHDSQIWYVCDICECPLNTREQFEIHKASPRHKAQEAKLARDKVEMTSHAEERPHKEDSGFSTLLDASEALHSAGSVTQDQLDREKNERDNALESNLQHLLFKPHTVTDSTFTQDSYSAHPNNSHSKRDGSLNFAQVSNQQAGSREAASHVQPVGVYSQSRLPTERYRVGLGAGNLSNVEQRESKSFDPNSQQAASFLSATIGVGSGGGNYTAGLNENRVFTARCQDDNSQNNTKPQSTGATSSSDLGNVTDRGWVGIASQPSFRRGSSNRSSGVPFRDIGTMASCDDDWDESMEVDGEEVERANFNISGNEDTSLSSALERTCISESRQRTLPPEKSTRQGFKYRCSVCDQHMNTKESYMAHVAGLKHKYMVSTEPVPKRSLPAICSVRTEEVCSRATQLTKDTPRLYQLELLEKAMARDTVIYLPTGTGKTLVAVLTIGLMLQENKTRPVLFLVDKVLLVLQQEKYIREQFAGKLFTRPDVYSHEDRLTERELLVMVICGGLFSKRDIPIWKHDIIVTTADFCLNMLSRGWIRWDDFSLVILDEVHHCIKSHPYLRLFARYHNQGQQYPITDGSPRQLPKVLGLSASPASKATVEHSYNMLRNLLANLGGAHIAMVEEQVPELDRYQSSAKVVPICVPMSNNEIEFTLDLLEYSLMCYVQLAHLCPDLKDYKVAPYSYFASAVQGTEEVG